MTAVRTITGALALALALGTGGCDKVKGLFGQSEAAPAEAKAEPAKAEPAKEAAPATTTAPIAKAEPAADAKVAPPPAAAPAPPAEAVAAAAPADAAVPCIVGRWKALDYMAEIRRAIHRDPTLRSMKHSSSGGLLGYQVDPPTDGKGVVKAKAEALRYVFSGKVEGYKVGLTVTLDGESEAAYTLVGDDTIIVAKPTTNTMKAHGVAKVEGFGKYSKSPKVDPDFDGTFVYTCDDKRLKVWRDKQEGEPLDFEREGS